MATIGGWSPPAAGEDRLPSDQASEAELLFVRRVGPLLTQHCVSCHGDQAEDFAGGLDLRSRRAAIAGGDSGEAAIRPGKPASSPLLLALRGADGWSPMPPKESQRLSDQQLAAIDRWIELGAAWPDEARVESIQRAHADRWSAEDGVTVATSGGQSPQWTGRRYDPADLWAYQPIRVPQLGIPASEAIDQLIEAALPEGLLPAGPAERATLARRLYFDLTGLPPTFEQLNQFVHHPADDEQAFAQLVDQLLQSPHYGERMAQHWMDVTRYADSSGLANDYHRGNAWRWRDYIVRSFNEDKPFDQMIVEQIAGDELDPDDPQMLIATGFLRMGPWELTGMEVAKVARQRFLDDVTNSVGETFLAHALQCARCHDHKFDPVPTRDYYAIQAVFATTQLAERRADWLAQENRDGFDQRQYLLRRQQHYRRQLQQLDSQLLEAAQGWFREHQISPDPWNAEVRKLQQQGNQRLLFKTARQRLMREGVSEDQLPPKLVGFSPQDYGVERVARKGLERLAWELETYQPFALSVYNGVTPQRKSVSQPTRVPQDTAAGGELERTCVLLGGDPFSPAEPVRPGVLSAVTGDDGTLALERQPGDAGAAELPLHGRRLALARWIASPDNPLSARVMANRVWQWHFGRGIAANANNFGTSGARPTHPELLDLLAAELIADGWSIKSLHRKILNTRAYRRSSRHADRKQLRELDPQESSYAVFRRRRLSAEEIRDAMLAVSGELNPELGGVPVRPQINAEAALQPRQVMGTFAAAWTPDPTPQQRHRRSLYTLRLRGLSDPLLSVFNRPSPDFSCERRQWSTVTPQVFSLFNSASSQSRALALADAAMRQTGSVDEAIRQCFRRALQREPLADEWDACRQHVAQLLPLVATARPHLDPPLQVTRRAVEENTGETFTFVEQLYAHEDFQPDLAPADVSAEVRALADLALVLLNCNEFIYVE